MDIFFNHHCCQEAFLRIPAECSFLKDATNCQLHCHQLPRASFIRYSRTKDTSRIEKLIRRAGSVVGMKLDSLVTVAEKRTLDKLLDILDDANQHMTINNQMSLFSTRLLLPKCRTNRLRNSFDPQAIRLYHYSIGGVRSNRKTEGAAAVAYKYYLLFII